METSIWDPSTGTEISMEMISIQLFFFSPSPRQTFSVTVRTLGTSYTAEKKRDIV
jgi:hypothetical protein